jgi:hypothetical protein
MCEVIAKGAAFLRTPRRRFIVMPQKSNDRDQGAASPVPQENEDELEMAEDDDEFEDEDEEFNDEAGAVEDEDVEE